MPALTATAEPEHSLMAGKSLSPPQSWRPRWCRPQTLSQCLCPQWSPSVRPSCPWAKSNRPVWPGVCADFYIQAGGKLRTSGRGRYSLPPLIWPSPESFSSLVLPSLKTSLLWIIHPPACIWVCHLVYWASFAQASQSLCLVFAGDHQFLSSSTGSYVLGSAMDF